MKGGTARHPSNPIHRKRSNPSTGTGESTIQDDRGGNVGGEHAGGGADDDHTGERNTRLYAKSLAAREDAPDGSEDGSPEAREQPDGSPDA